jgi:hypothetical protein
MIEESVTYNIIEIVMSTYKSFLDRKKERLESLAFQNKKYKLHEDQRESIENAKIYPSKLRFPNSWIFPPY